MSALRSGRSCYCCSGRRRADGIVALGDKPNRKKGGEIEKKKKRRNEINHFRFVLSAAPRAQDTTTATVRAEEGEWVEAPRRRGECKKGVLMKESATLHEEALLLFFHPLRPSAAAAAAPSAVRKVTPRESLQSGCAPSLHAAKPWAGRGRAGRPPDYRNTSATRRRGLNTVISSVAVNVDTSPHPGPHAAHAALASPLPRPRRATRPDS